MKSIQFNAYGDSSVLAVKEIDRPVCEDDEVLIEVYATTVNPFDMKVRDGKMQKMIPTQFPSIPGLDVAGLVKVVGDKVKTFKVDDEVFATTFGGTYAEYVALKEFQVGIRPKNVSMNEAASLAVPLVTAYTLLVETAQLKAHQRILVNGAAGAVGSAIVQMAKSIGAYVIGTASGDGIIYLKSIGADEAIDYKTQDFEALIKDVDLVADLVGGESQAKSFTVLKKGGQLISIVMPPSAELAEKFGVNAKFINSGPGNYKLEYGRNLVESGKIKPNIAKTFELEQAAQAQDAVTKGGLNGKVVIEVRKGDVKSF